MGFSEKQRRALSRKVPSRCVRTRVMDGRELSYIEGWYAIGEANRIFGFEGWDRETVETRCVFSREAKGTFHVAYAAKVRVTVRTDAQTIVREGYGTGEGRGSSPAEAHERALKSAETDGTKRALVTFGKPFGLALYSNAVPPNTAKKKTASLSAGMLREPRARPPNLLPDGLSGPAPWRRPGPSLQKVAQESNAEINGTGGNVPDHSEQFWRQPKTLTYRRRDRDHLKFVATQPCLICGRAPSDPHHLRFTQPRALGSKVSDEFTVPLCREHHRELHQSGNETNWWNRTSIDPIPIARKLWNERQPMEVNQ